MQLPPAFGLPRKARPGVGRSVSYIPRSVNTQTAHPDTARRGGPARSHPGGLVGAVYQPGMARANGVLLAPG